MIELYSNKNSGNPSPIFTSTPPPPPPLQVYPPFQAKHFVPPPQVTQFLGLETLGDKLIFLVVEGESTSLLR